MAIDNDKLNAFLGKFVGDLSACAAGAVAVLGHRLGLYKALTASGPTSSTELAKRTEMNERYVREWLASQAAGGYVEYDAKTERYSMTEEQSFVLADETSPAFLPGGFQVMHIYYGFKDSIRLQHLHVLALW